MKILHLEDMATDAELVGIEIKRAKIGFQKLDVDNKADYVKALDEYQPDIILSDHSLPSFNSVEALDILKQKALNIPFILVTATISEEFAVNIMKQGATDYILKDRMQRLPGAVLNAVEKFRLAAEREKYLNDIIASEGLLKQAEDIALIGSLDIDLIAGKRKWSPGMDKILGYKTGEMEQSFETFLNCVHPEDLSRLKNEIAYSVAYLDKIDLEFRIVTPEKEIKYIHSKLIITKEKHGRAIRARGFIQDITERKIAEIKLNQADYEIKRLFDTIDEVFFSRDIINSRLIQVSPGCEKMYGYTQEEFFAEPNLWSRIIHPDYVQASLENLQKYRKGETIVSQYQIFHKTNGLRWAESKVIPTLDDKGILVRYDGVTRDITERKQAEENRFHSEQRYRQIVETAQEGIWMIDENLHTIFVNKKMCDILGYAPEEMMGRHNYDFKEEADRAETIRGLKNNGHQTIAPYDSVFITKSGKRVICSVSINSIFNPDGSYLGYLSMLTDITQRKAHENALKRSEANLSAIIENTTDMVFSLNRELKFITFNKLFKDTIKLVYGFDVEQGIDIKGLLTAYDGELASKWKGIYDRALNGETQHFTNENDSNNDKVYLSYSINPIWETGKVIGLSCFSRDITQQKLDEAALIKSEANLRSVFENTDLSIVLFDNSLNIVSFNSNAAKLAIKNWGKELITGSSAYSYFDAERKQIIEEYVKKAENKEPVDYEVTFDQPDGTREYYGVKWIGVFNQKNENVGIIFALNNITAKKISELEREKITADLIRRNKDLEQFTYIISHNLRAPLANIKGLSNLLNYFEINDTDCLETLKSLSASVDNLDNVIIDLNQILQTGRQVNESSEMVSLPGLVDEIVAEIKPMVLKNKVVLNCNFNELNSLLVLKSYMYSIFQNLIINSIKYRKVETNPVIDIITKRNGDNVILTFEDNGKGIDLAKYGAHLFGLYKRFDFTVEGKGMGLFMVKMQVESLGGTIKVESELDKGTKFLIELPL